MSLGALRHLAVSADTVTKTHWQCEPTWGWSITVLNVVMTWPSGSSRIPASDFWSGYNHCGYQWSKWNHGQTLVCALRCQNESQCVHIGADHFILIQKQFTPHWNCSAQGHTGHKWKQPGASHGGHRVELHIGFCLASCSSLPLSSQQNWADNPALHQGNIYGSILFRFNRDSRAEVKSCSDCMITLFHLSLTKH